MKEEFDNEKKLLVEEKNELVKQIQVYYSFYFIILFIITKTCYDLIIYNFLFFKQNKRQCWKNSTLKKENGRKKDTSY